MKKKQIFLSIIIGLAAIISIRAQDMEGSGAGYSSTNVTNVSTNNSIKSNSSKVQVNQTVQSSIRDQAFNSVASTISPLDESQVKEVRKLWNESQRMSTFMGAAPPTPVNSMKSINLSNGTLPSVVRLGAGYVSVVSFFDSTGQIWPIQAYDIGNPGAVNIVWNEDKLGSAGHSNTLLMQAQTLYKSTNMVVMLKGLNTPVLLEIIPGQKQVDYRLDFQVPSNGPYAKYENSTDYGKEINPIMMEILNNIPPRKSIQAHVTGGEAQAWLFNRKIYIRTPLDIISPAWLERVNSANGSMHVYEMPVTSAFVALSNGKVVKLQIEGV